jgi:hypothetical protein
MQHHQTAHQTAGNIENHKTKHCVSCGSQMTENYCGTCGEKKFDHHDLTLKHYLEESFEGITHFDNKFFKSVKLLITKPGLLSVDYCRGKRIPYMRPFALFFVCNIIYFLLMGPTNLFSTPLTSFYNFYPFTEFHTKEIIDHLAPTNEDFKIVALSFNEKMGIQSKAFLVVFVPLIAIAGVLVQRKRLLAEHLIFSTHFFAFILLFYIFLSGGISNLYYIFFVKGNYDSTYDIISALMALLVFGAYYFFSAKRFYKASTVRALIGSIVAVFLYTIFVYGYRMLLFYKIIHSMKI